jgi:hypothetical protein
MLTANLADRTISGLVLPFNEVGRTNKGKVKARKGTLKLAPVVTLNTQHDGVHVGLKAEMNEADDGWYGSFNVHEGPEGDSLLAEVDAGKRNMLSVEIPDVVIRAGEIVTGTISSVAAVVTGAFPSALMAADAGELPADLPDWYMPSESSSESTEEIVIEGVTYVRTTTTTNKTTVTPKGDAENPQEEENMGDENATPTPTDNGIVAGLQAALEKAGLQVQKEKPAMSPAAAFRAIAQHQARTGASLEAALAVVTHDDGDDDGDGVGEISAPQGWLGEVWKQVPYVRRFAPLLSHGNLTHYRERGFRVVTKPVVAAYAGNGAEVPTGGMTVEPAEYVVDRLAHGADIDRRYIDFKDSAILQAFVEAQAQSYEEVIDGLAEDYIAAQADVEAAGAFAADVAPGLVGLVDGALALIGDRYRPTSAVMGVDLYRDVLLTPRDEILAYLTTAFGLEEGGMAGFRIVPSAKPAYAGKVAVLDNSTLRLKELPGATPLRVEAEKPSNGTQTLAVFGYYSLQNLKDGGARIVTPALVAPAP